MPIKRAEQPPRPSAELGAADIARPFDAPTRRDIGSMVPRAKAAPPLDAKEPEPLTRDEAPPPVEIEPERWVDDLEDVTDDLETADTK